MNKPEKGCWGYRRHFRRMRMLGIGILAVLIVIFLLTRRFTDNRSLYIISTIGAVVAVIPAANLAAPLLATWRFTTPPREFYEAYRKYEEKFPILYDLTLTTKEDIMPIDVMVVHPTGYYGLCVNGKGQEKRAEEKQKLMLEASRLDPRMHVIKDRRVFDKRLQTLKPASEYEDDGTQDYAQEVLKKLSM